MSVAIAHSAAYLQVWFMHQLRLAIRARHKFQRIHLHIKSHSHYSFCIHSQTQTFVRVQPRDAPHEGLCLIIVLKVTIDSDKGPEAMVLPRI